MKIPYEIVDGEAHAEFLQPFEYRRCRIAIPHEERFGDFQDKP